jgi:hypothetical protein
MIFSLDVRRARKGDCLLLHFGSKTEPGLVMIDGGPSDVFVPQLRPRLLKIKQVRGLGEGQPLPVDVLMVSHVDDDHIKGILDLTRELIAQPEGSRAVRVVTLWHNTFDDVIGNTPKELTAAVIAQFGAASLSGELPDDATIDLGEVGEDDEEVAESSLKVLASLEQGHRLRDDADKLAIDLNTEFGGKLILADKEAMDMGGGLTLTVAGPMKPELLQLQKKHDEWLKELQKKPKPPGAALAAYVDKSVPNLSSLVVLARSGGKSILLTGDARGDKILQGLEMAGALEAGKTMHVDVLKVPHHGSSNNLARSFFERVTADHYVFSGDGEHGNPEREAFEMLFKARATQPFTIHLTYEIDHIDGLRKADWEKEQTKEKNRKAAGGKKEPRADWSPEKQSLTTFFTPGRLASGQKLQIVCKSSPHVIDLLDPLGF